MRLHLLLFSSSLLLAGVDGHGAVVWPPNWQDGQAIPLDERWNKEIVGPYVDEPTNKPYNKSYTMLTDQAYLGGHGNEYKGKGKVTNEDCLSSLDDKCRNDKTPWSSPGKAPVLGGGCGAFGGNPYGCPAHKDSKAAGHWCHDDCEGCNGWNKWTWAFGASALDTSYSQAKTTRWTRGEIESVAYVSNNGHGGGYTYRLYKLPSGEGSKDERKAGLTEEHFANNILTFATNYTETRLTGKRNLGSEWRKEFKEDITEGTNPPGSAWRPLAKREGSGKGKTKFNKDFVKVPKGITKGEYVLSWRWDTATAPQIWMSCAWIDIV